ncbi:hypothetical protein DAPPUDRAFT_326115 [Daphnia pulex]|uniref:Uncharacterized protein n=1 Tax=Daphnia pulex TaxID=6669 RepID=E9H6S2_DAPPU|nr:hypothetical protein DAPPUDRAFT_326115 [Daphnia pulex]|eukprot:EFX72557.1 hypothetical protein DAPPUDRAFT_326115 [Daphnia pulex]
MSFKSCFPSTPKPLPGTKKAYPNIESRAVPNSVRRLSKVEPRDNDQSLSLSKFSTLLTPRCPLPSKIPVRKQEGTFSTKVKPAPKEQADNNVIFFHWCENSSKIPVRVKSLHRTDSRPRNAIKEVTNSGNLPAVPRNKPICSGDAMASTFQKRVLVNGKSNIPVRLTQNSPAGGKTSENHHLKKSDGLSCGMKCNCVILPAGMPINHETKPAIPQAKTYTGAVRRITSNLETIPEEAEEDLVGLTTELAQDLRSSFPDETKPPLTRKQKVNQRTNRRKKEKKRRDAAQRLLSSTEEE